MHRSQGRIVFWLLASLVLVTMMSCAKSEWSGRCVGVMDGDTISVMHEDRAEKIRLFGVDAPERGQDFGEKARSFMSQLVFGKVVKIKPVETDRYHRTVAWVFVDGVNVNKELLKAGLAWWYQHHAPKERELEKLEREARSKQLGLWSMKSPIPPWRWREEKRAHE